MKLLKASNSRKIIKEIVGLIEKGRVLVLPTDTVYGLVCNAKNENAVRKLLRIKKRRKSKPFPLFVKDIKMAKEIACVDKVQEKVLKHFWPGNITFVLKRKKSFRLAGPLRQKETIGLRIPKNKLINDLFGKINFPLAQSSANISGKGALTKIKEVLKQFLASKEGSLPDQVLYAGDLKKGKASAVVDLTAKRPKILRKDTISKKELFKFFKK